MEHSSPSVVTIPLGNANAFAIRDRQGAIVVDAGQPGREKKLIEALKRNGIAPEQIRLVVVTHVHYDHVGSLAALRNAAACSVAVHEREAALLQKGDVVFPAGTGSLGRWLVGMGSALSRLFPGQTRYAPVEADIFIAEETSLASFGIAGAILPTPGHTAGSLSVLLPDGSAFVGDLAFNVFPWGGPIFPPFADDVPRLLESWDLLLARGVTTIYPGHGKPFPAEMLRQAYEKHMPK